MATILNWDAEDVTKFKMVTGISDSSCFNEMPSWQQPSGMQDRCYVGACSLYSTRRSPYDAVRLDQSVSTTKHRAR